MGPFMVTSLCEKSTIEARGDETGFRMTLNLKSSTLSANPPLIGFAGHDVTRCSCWEEILRHLDSLNYHSQDESKIRYNHIKPYITL